MSQWDLYGNEIYDDLKDYIENGKNYLIFIDDINEMSRVKSFMDFVKDKKDICKIKVIATVRDYVLEQCETKAFLEKIDDMLQFLIPNYQKEGKRQLIISIGCTGGRHRSVAIANEIYENLHDKNFNVYIEHRDIKEDVHKGDKKL